MTASSILNARGLYDLPEVLAPVNPILIRQTMRVRVEQRNKDCSIPHYRNIEFECLADDLFPVRMIALSVHDYERRRVILSEKTLANCRDPMLAMAFMVSRHTEIASG